jgi:soluble lytic murein transglycosylase-like protein
MQRVVNAPSPVLPDCMRSVALLAAEPAGAADPFIDMPPAKKKVVEAVMRAAPRYIIEPDLALAVVAAESNFQFDARSDKGAVGVMQLIPATAERFEVKNRLNIDDNVQGGLAYLRWLLAYYEGYVALAVAAYNAGEDAVDKYRGIPPYPETRAYVQRVQRLYPIERHVYDPSVVEASAILRPAGSGSK